MKKNLIKAVAALPGVPMLLNGVGFLFNPVDATASLGMPLLDGIARSTQLGDFAAFFLATAALIFYGAFTGKGQWLFAAALYLGGAAIFRTFASLVNGADFATVFIVVEVVLALWLCVAGYLLNRVD